MKQYNLRVRKTYNRSLDIVSDAGNVEIYDMFPHEINDILFACYEVLNTYYARDKERCLSSKRVFNSDTGLPYSILVTRSGREDTTTISVLSDSDKDSYAYFRITALTYNEFLDLTHFLNQYIMAKEYVS